MDDLKPATPREQPSRRIGSHTWICLGFLYSFYFTDGAVRLLSVPMGLISIVFIANVVNLALWVVLDARRHGHPIPHLSQNWFVIFAAVLVPGYILYSRRWWGIGWLAIHFIGIYMAMMIGYLAVWFTIYGVA